MIDVICLATVLVLGQQAPPPPPPPAAPVQAPRDAATGRKGTAAIKGHVRGADGRLLRRAEVRVWSDSPQNAATATTGPDGEYELTELPAGRYTLEAKRSGYLSIQYGASRYGEAGTPVAVEDGARIEKIDFSLSRAGVVSGRVTDETGDAVAGADIRAMQMQFYLGRKRLVPVNTVPVHVHTDDSGQYRLTGMPPGDYYIWSRLPETWMSDEKEPQVLSYAPTYYPGTADIAGARLVKITAGQEAGAIDFTLVPMRAATLSGTALSSNGAPLTAGRIILSVEITGPSGGTMGFGGNTIIKEDGTWRIEDVAPGDYVIRASGSVDGGPTETAVVPVSVYGIDVEGLVIAADVGAFISGRVVTESGDPLPPGSRPVVGTRPVSLLTGTVQIVRGIDDGVVGADGSFTRKTASGPVVLRVSSLPDGWGVKRIEIAGRDFARVPLDVPPGATVGGVTVVITNRLASLSGRVTGATRGASVLLFPVDPTRWIEAAENQRTTRPDRTGEYTFSAVPAGEYFVIALESMEAWQMNDPDFLVLQRGRATRVRIDTEPVTIDLEVKR